MQYYDSADSDKVVAESVLDPDHKIGLLRLSQIFDKLYFDTLDTFNMESCDIELSEQAKPHLLKRVYNVHKPI